MATPDFPPLLRSSIGFDRLPGLLSDPLGELWRGIPINAGTFVSMSRVWASFSACMTWR
jgi:hypothetical protein